MQELQDTYDELDNIITTLENLIDETTNKEYIQQLQEIKWEAEKELDKVQEKLREEYEENEKLDMYEYQRSVL